MLSPHLREPGANRRSSFRSGSVAAAYDTVSSAAAGDAITGIIATITAELLGGRAAGNHWRQRDGNDRWGRDFSSPCLSFWRDRIHSSSSLSIIDIALTSSIGDRAYLGR